MLAYGARFYLSTGGIFTVVKLVLNELLITKSVLEFQEVVAKFNDYFSNIDPMNVMCELDIQLLTKNVFSD